ncbi:hypothetical protein Tco_1274557 [Tanacetum coccineum]
MEALTTRIDSQFKEIKGDMKEMRDGCNECGGPHPSSDCDDKPMGGPKEEEANYASGGYRGGYRGNYYGQNSSNWRDRQSYHRDENRNSNLGEENPPILRLPEKKPVESEFEKIMREFVIAQKVQRRFCQNQFIISKANSRNTKDKRITKLRFKTLKQSLVGFLITNFQDLRCLTIPKPNQNLQHQTKDLIDRRAARNGTVECVFTLQWTQHSSIQGSHRSLETPKVVFLIPCKLANSVEYLALADLGASINLMSYSLYTALFGTTLKPTRMSIILTSTLWELLRIYSPFLHTVDAIKRVKKKELNFELEKTLDATFHIDKAMQHSHVNDDTCFRMDVIDEITEDELDTSADASKTHS